MIYADHIEDYPHDPNMVIAYVAYGTPNQVAYLMERAMVLTVEPSRFFVDMERDG